MTQPSIPEEIAALRWEVQIGPEVNGSASGLVNSYTAMFYVATGGSDTYAWYSTNAGYPNTPIPNNQVVHASGQNLVQWRYSVPNGVQIKFLMRAH